MPRLASLVPRLSFRGCIVDDNLAKEFGGKVALKVRKVIHNAS